MVSLQSRHSRIMAIELKAYIRAKLAKLSNEQLRPLLLAAYKFLGTLPNNSDITYCLFSDGMSEEMSSDILHIIKNPHGCVYKSPVSAVVMLRMIVWSAICATLDGMAKPDIDKLKAMFPKYLNAVNLYEQGFWNDSTSAKIMIDLGLIKSESAVLYLDSRHTANFGLRWGTLVPKNDRTFFEVLDQNYVRLADSHIPMILTGDTCPPIGGLTNIMMPGAPMSKIQAAWLIKFSMITDKHIARFIADQGRKAFGELCDNYKMPTLPDIARQYTNVSVGNNLDYWSNIYNMIVTLVVDSDNVTRVVSQRRATPHHSHLVGLQQTTPTIGPHQKNMGFCGLDDYTGGGLPYNRRYQDTYWGRRDELYYEKHIPVPEKERKKDLCLSSEEAKIKSVKTLTEQTFDWVRRVLSSKGWTWTNV